MVRLNILHFWKWYSLNEKCEYNFKTVRCDIWGPAHEALDFSHLL